MDYGPFIQQHRRKRADVTIAVKRVPIGEAHRFGILALDDNDAGHRVAGEAQAAQERPREPGHLRVLASARCSTGSPRTAPTSARNVIPAMLDGGARVFGYRFDGYWQDVGTVDSYWQAQMELLDDHPQLDLYDRDWVIHTRSEERAPARIGPTASVHRSLISHGCLIAGTVERSVLSPGRARRPGRHRARQRGHVRRHHPRRRRRGPRDPRQGGVGRAQRGRRHGRRLRRRPTQAEPTRLNTGITLVGKRAVIPAGARIGRNVRIGEDVRPSDFPSRTVKSGGSVERVRRGPQHGADPSRRRRGRGRSPVEPRSRGAAPLAATAERGHGRVDVDGWLAELGIAPVERAERDGIDQLGPAARRAPRATTSGSRSSSTRRSRSLCWVHYAPPISDSFRVSLSQAPALERRAAVREVRGLRRTSGRC